MNSNKNILKISADTPQISVLSLIKTELKKDAGILYIDLTDTAFPLSRDFFFVLSRRFHSDEIILIVEEESEMAMAKSIGIQAELKGTFAEFEREYEKKNLLAHNMTMLQYLRYEIKRGASYIYFILFQKFFARKKERILHFRESSPNMILMI